MSGKSQGVPASAKASQSSTPTSSDFSILTDDPNATNIAILVGVSVLILTILFYWFSKRDSGSRKYTVLLGSSNSGKTTLFSQLVYKKPILTYTSIIENKSVAKISRSEDKSTSKSVELIDIPGNDKVRRKYLDQYRKSIKSIVFVVDSSTFTKDSKDVAQYLFEILTDETLSKFKLNILIACNKQDLEFAKGKSLIQSTLEKEIDLLRRIASSALRSTNESGKSKSGLRTTTSDDQAFEFNDLKTARVDFCECNALTAGEDSPSGGSGDAKLSNDNVNIRSVVDWVYTNA